MLANLKVDWPTGPAGFDPDSLVLFNHKRDGDVKMEIMVFIVLGAKKESEPLAEVGKFGSGSGGSVEIF